MFVEMLQIVGIFSYFSSTCTTLIVCFKTIKLLVWTYDVRVMDMKMGGCRIATRFRYFIFKELVRSFRNQIE